MAARFVTWVVGGVYVLENLESLYCSMYDVEIVSETVRVSHTSYRGCLFDEVSVRCTLVA